METMVGMEVFSTDGQPVGRVTGYVAQIPEDEIGMVKEPADPIELGSRQEHSRHVLVDGHGYVTQAIFSVPEEQIEVDERGRRITLRMSMEEIRELPRR